MYFLTGLQYKNTKTSDTERRKIEREIAKEKFKKMYGITDTVYEKNFTEKKTKS